MYRTHYPGPDPPDIAIFVWYPDPAGSWYEKKIRIWFRPDLNLKKKSGSGSGRILIWKKYPGPVPAGS